MELKKLLVFVIGCVLIMSTAYAAEADTTLPLSNAAPTVGTITATDPVTLSADSSVTVWCNATVTDTNGHDDIVSASAVLWGPTSTEGGADNYNNHYTQASCDFGVGDGNTKDALCSFSVRYSAENGEWSCKITATDGSSATGTATKADVTVNVLTAIGIQGTLVFDETALGAIATEKSFTVSNKGNSQVDVELYTYGATDDDGLSFVCTSGTIEYTALKYNMTAAQDYATNMSTIGRISTTPVTEAGFDLAKDSNATASTKELYWKIQVPASGVGGTCTGKLGVLATISS